MWKRENREGKSRYASEPGSGICWRWSIDRGKLVVIYSDELRAKNNSGFS